MVWTYKVGRYGPVRDVLPYCSLIKLETGATILHYHLAPTGRGLWAAHLGGSPNNGQFGYWLPGRPIFLPNNVRTVEPPGTS